jgi:glycosyltransferase involved in cell wall biosynthesis
MDISVVIPVRDEAENIPDLVNRLVHTFEKMSVSFEVIFVTDFNRDNTVDILRKQNRLNPKIRALKLSTARGQHIAVVAGLDACCGHCAVLMDGDMQDYPEDIPKLYARMKEGFDIVYAVKERKNDSSLRNLFSKSFVSVLNWLSDQKLAHNTGMFRIISGRTIAQLRRFREYEQSLTGLMALVNFPTSTVQVTSGQRMKGQTKYSFLRQVNFAIEFLLGFTTKPLRLISLLGLIVAGISFAYLVTVIVRAVFVGIAVIGWPTLVSLITLLSGMQLLALGTIGEYVGRIFLESKRRPLYVVEEVIGESSGTGPLQPPEISDLGSRIP